MVPTHSHQTPAQMRQHITNLNGVNKAKDLAAQTGSAETHLTPAPQSAQETLVTDELLKGSHFSVSILLTPRFSHLVQPTGFCLHSCGCPGG